MASLSDDFNRVDGEIGANWTEDNGDIDIVSNYAKNITDSGINRARYTASTLDSSDHCVEADVFKIAAQGNNPDCGPVARQASSTATYYQAGYLSESDGSGYTLRKVVAGSETALDTAASGSGEKTVKLTVDGATQSMEVDTVEVCTDTDSDITTGLYCGIAGYKARGQYNSWSAEDLAAGSSEERAVAGILPAMAGILVRKYKPKRLLEGAI